MQDVWKGGEEEIIEEALQEWMNELYKTINNEILRRMNEDKTDFFLSEWWQK